MLAFDPARRPLRPMRRRNDATVTGASIWITRSWSPTSSPSSSALVATITQSLPTANASWACRRSSREIELCDTYVSTPSPYSAAGSPPPRCGCRIRAASRPGEARRSPSPQRVPIRRGPRAPRRRDRDRRTPPRPVGVLEPGGAGDCPPSLRARLADRPTATYPEQQCPQVPCAGAGVVTRPPP
jgi:hypothetical protein